MSEWLRDCFVGKGRPERTYAEVLENLEGRDIFWWEFMYDNLKEMFAQGLYGDVLTEISKFDLGEFTEELLIIAASALLAVEEYETARQYLQMGLLKNPRNPEFYLLLGNYYEHFNRMQAYLCYENAEMYCEDMQDKLVIRSFMRNLETEDDSCCRRVAIVILSYNTYEMTRFCIESIRRNNSPDSYEIIVVDNASVDASLEWLEKQQDIILIKNSENMGFPYGCNQGIEAAGPETDIMLLNSDTILFCNSLFWLRMGLYEGDNIGAVGAVTNHASNGQTISERFETIQEYEQYALRNNILRENPYERKLYLVGFAVLIRREAINEVGGLDIRYSPGQFEDVDLGMCLCQKGYQNILCHNSFIYHFGGSAGQNSMVWQEQYRRNKEVFKDKWGFDITYYSHIRTEIVEMLDCSEDANINVLEVGCGLGATLDRIQYQYPLAHVYGMELVPEVARIGGCRLNIVRGDIEEDEIPFKDVKFDYIILADVLEHLHEPEQIILLLRRYLKEEGAFLCSIPNLMNLSVIYPLLQGKFEYVEAGILDRTHLRFFTLESILRLFSRCGLRIENLQSVGSNKWNEMERQCLEKILQIPGCAGKEQFLARQYLFRAKVM